MLDAFYRAVLPEQGVYALFEVATRRHVWCRDIETLTRETLARVDTPDIYFATASFVEPTERTIENALYRRAFCFDIDAGPAKIAKIEARIAAGKAPESARDSIYVTQADALQGLVRWCQGVGLAPAWVLSSGAGLHAYFVLDQDTSIDDWQPVATAIKAKALFDGLRIDGGITGDPARILRPVGTLHNNGNRVEVLKHLPAAVYTLEALRAKLGVSDAAPRARVRRLNDEILEAPVGPPKLLSKIAERCPAMAHAMQARGDIAEPYWRAMLGVIKFTVEGQEAAHAYSEGHPDYDYDETQKKLDRWTAGPTSCATFEVEHPQACASCRYRGQVKSPALLGMMTDQERAAAPELEPAEAQTPTPTAESELGMFESLDATEADEVATPAAVEPWVEHLPTKYRVVRSPAGARMIHKRAVTIKNEDDQDVTIEVDAEFAAVPFWFESWAPGTSNDDQAQAVYCVYDEARQATARYTMPTKVVASRTELFGVLASQNVHAFPNTKQAKDTMEDYVKASVERIRAAGQRQKISDRFGTSFTPKGDVVVAQGRHIISKDGTIFEGVVHERLKGRGQAYRVPLPENGAGTWGPEVWDDYILPRAHRHIEYLREFYADYNFLPYQLAIMLAWGSPMLAFMQGNYHPGAPLPGIGLTVSLYSPLSGIGKSAAMQAAALAFGAPTGVVLQLDDSNATDNARQGLLLQSGTMPGFMDEMENVRPEVLAGFISSVGNGASKLRMTKELGLSGGVTTALINVMSTNKSHRELVTADRSESTAVQMRLLEIECSGVIPVGRERAEQETAARASLYDCAGAVGAVIHRAMVRMGAERLNQLGLECASVARAALDGNQDGRFMWRALGAMLAVRRILKAAGLQVFDGAQLQAEFRRWHDAGYEFSAQNVMPTGGADLMALFLSDIAPQTLITRTEGTKRALADDGRVEPALNERFPAEVLARSVLAGRFVYVKTEALRDWAAKRRISATGMLARCREAGVLDLPGQSTRNTHRVDLLSGTRGSQGLRVQCYKVWLDRVDGADALYQREMGNVVALRSRTAEAAPSEDGAAEQRAP